MPLSACFWSVPVSARGEPEACGGVAVTSGPPRYELSLLVRTPFVVLQKQEKGLVIDGMPEVQRDRDKQRRQKYPKTEREGERVKYNSQKERETE